MPKSELYTDIKLDPLDLEVDSIELLLAWRQDREVMKYLPSAPEQPTWEDHYRHLQKKDTTYYWVKINETIMRVRGVDEGGGLISEFTCRSVGVVHWKRDGEVGIIIGEKGLWGRDVGKKALGLLLKKLPIGTSLWAVIHPENIASQKVFEANGFAKTDEPGRNGQLVYRSIVRQTN